MIDRVVDYWFSKKGDLLAYTTSLEGDKDSLDLNILVLSTLDENVLIEKQLAVEGVNWDEEGEQLCFLSTADTNEKKNFDLYLWTSKTGNYEVAKLVDSTTAGLPEGWTVSEFYRPWFSKDASKLYLGTNEIVRQDPEDSLLDTEKAKVDVWNYKDARIQPEQLKSKSRDSEKTYLAVFHFGDMKLVQLSEVEHERVILPRFGNGKTALIRDQGPYMLERTWEIPFRYDYHWLDLVSGARGPIASGLFGELSLSPSGEYAVWYNVDDSAWYGKHINDRENIKLTEGISDTMAWDVNGMKMRATSWGNAGWTKVNAHEYLLINSVHDVWGVSPANPKRRINVSGGTGQKENIVFRLDRHNRDSVYVDLRECWLHGTHLDDYSESYSNFQLNVKDRSFVRTELIHSKHMFIQVDKAKKSNKVLLRRQNFQDSGELEATDVNFKEPKTLTVTNTNRDSVNWGTVEIVEWTNYKGEKNRGMLFKPEDFDPTKKYPMITYFYEKRLRLINIHYGTRVTRSSINMSEYTSNGYVIFLPNVHYELGHPGQGAYDCIVSGTDALVKRFDWIDSTKLGLQGQSWGGYQTAQLVTMTNKYAAAMAGAPVSNMFSAYGGIRWGSGWSRQFQYENTQSRIGHTIWERPDLYVENSPVFHLPNVETPLMIMHNDKDGAVPWYQGIELFMGMRRLGKPCWMVNYNGDAHNLTKMANRKDLNKRMKQFFDHYLMDKPMPKWMKEGVPAVDKGKNYGFESIDTDR